jgi:hypothetical protein
MLPSTCFEFYENLLGVIIAAAWDAGQRGGMGGSPEREAANPSQQPSRAWQPYSLALSIGQRCERSLPVCTCVPFVVVQSTSLLRLGRLVRLPEPPFPPQDGGLGRGTNELNRQADRNELLSRQSQVLRLVQTTCKD